MSAIPDSQTCVIVALDSHCEHHLLLDFLPSLRGAARYEGRVCVIDYGLSEQTREQAAKLADEIVSVPKEGHVVVQRFRDAARLIRQLPEQISHVLMIDATDVWFQAPFPDLWDLVGQGIGFMEEDYVRDSASMLRWLGELPRPFCDTWAQTLRDTRSVNMGMNAGHREAMVWFYEEITRLCEQCGTSRYGLDQLAACYALRSAQPPFPLVSLPAKFNYGLLYQMGDLTLQGHVFLDAQGNAPAIIHNLGGTSRPVKGPWVHARTDSKAMAHFMTECLFRRIRSRGFKYLYLRDGLRWFRRAPLVVTRQLLRLSALALLPEGLIRSIVALRKRYVQD